ncbi:Cytochrome p450 86a2 [Globisporangium polare]
MSALHVQVAGTLVTIVLSPVVASILSSLRRKMRAAKALELLPGPKGTFLLGILPELVRNLDRIYFYQEELMLKHGPRIKVPWTLFANNYIYTSNPDDVQHVLSTNFTNYLHSKQFSNAFGQLFAKSFVGLNHAHTADGGEMWRVQRKLAAKVFTTTNFRLFAEDVFYKHANTMVDIIRSQRGKCDMHEIASQYSLQAIFDISCGVPLKSVDPSLGLGFVESLGVIREQTIRRLITAPYYRFFWWCMPSEYRMKRHEQVMAQLADTILEKRLQESGEEIEQRFDIVSLFIKKARELSEEDSTAGVVLDVETLRSVFLTFIFAGWETTSSVIVWTFYMLAQYPEHQQKIVDEMEEKAIGDSTSSDLSFDDVRTLKYLDAVVSETMRLYPTVPFDTKQAVEDDHLPDGTFVPAGTEVLYNTWYMGRNNPIWGPDPLEFRPQRWLEMTARPSPYELPVFQGGPRVCPGRNMALLEVKILIARLLKLFSVKIQDGEKVKDRGFTLNTTLTIKDGLPLQMTPRKAVGISH